jgi:branched-chain amino acid transport system substrate-binding protein
MALCLLAVLGGCTPVPPVTKIGLIAPFEGLYRESGYAALAALRSALAECAPSGMAVVPLALDGSVDPARAAQKLLVDPSVRAVIGPLDLSAAAAVAGVLKDRSIPWIAPLLVNPARGFAAWPDGAGLAALAAAVRQAMQPPARLVVAGLPPALATPGLEGAGVLRIDEAGAAQAALQPGDALLWLGSPAEGAALLQQVTARRPDARVWLGPQGGDPVFATHLSALQAVHWSIWIDSGYNQWAQSHEPGTPSSYLVYQAACTALAAAAGKASPPAPAWQLQSYRIGPDGVSEPLAAR